MCNTVALPLQGVANNAQGLGAELDVAESAPGVTAVSRRFWAAPLQRAAGAACLSPTYMRALLPCEHTVDGDWSARLEQPSSTADTSPLHALAGPEQGLGRGPDDTTASCEVDVIAQQGHAWVEVKSHGPFGVHSTHWLGSAGHNKGEECIPS
jgi:hypothetical protein